MGVAKTLGQRLKNFRQKKGLRIDEIAEFVGVAASTYREWEYGRAIRGEPYTKLAQVLDISLLELITGESSPKTQSLVEIEKIEHHLKMLKFSIRNISGNETK